jgi:hypothetical protein
MRRDGRSEASPVTVSARATAALLATLVAAAGYAVLLGRVTPPAEWLLFRVATFWAYAALFTAACLAAGRLVVDRALGRDSCGLEAAVASMAAGVVTFALGTFALGTFALGFLHAFGAPFAILWPVAMLAAGGRRAVGWLRDEALAIAARPPRLTPLAAIVAAAGLGGVALVYLGALTPDAIGFDAAWFHLAVAADYARLGGVVPFPGDYMRGVPHLASLLYTWALLLPGLGDEPSRWMMAQHLELLLFLWTLAGISAVTRFLLDEDARGAWAAFFLFPAIFVYDSNLSAAADHVLAFFAAPVFLVAMRAATSRALGPWALLGALAGGALLTKYQAVELLGGVGVVLAVRWALAARAARRATGARAASLVVGPAVAALALALVTAPHFAKNWVYYGNPVYPFAQEHFPGSWPTVPGGAFLVEHLMKDPTARPRGSLGEIVLGSLGLVFTYSFAPHYSFTKGTPSSGSIFTLGLPLLALVRGGRRIALGAAAACAALFVWAMTLRVDRHLQTFLPLLVATSAALLARAWELGRRARVGVATLVAVQVLGEGDAVVSSSRVRLASALALLARSYDAGDRAPPPLDYRRDYRELGASLPRDARLVLHNWRPNLGIDRDLVFDMPGQQGLLAYDEAVDPRALWTIWRSVGATHVVHRPGLRPAQTRQQEVLVADLVTRAARSRRAFGALELVELPDAPPAPGAPYLVLAVGLDGYEDGLYPVEALGVNEALEPALRRYPAPSEPLPARTERQLALAARAAAALRGPRSRPSAALEDALARGFEVARTYDELTVYLRVDAGP